MAEKVLSYDADANELLLNKAYVYAMKAHGSQKRDSGDLYFSHPLEVAAIWPISTWMMLPSSQRFCMIQLKILMLHLF